MSDQSPRTEPLLHVDVEMSESYVVPPSVQAALDRLWNAAGDDADVEGFTFRPKLSFGELMPASNEVRRSVLGLTCKTTYSESSTGFPTCKTVYDSD